MINGADAKDILAVHGRSFHWAAQILPRSCYDKAARLYALCRTLDDAVDRATSPLDADERLRAALPVARTMLDRLLRETKDSPIGASVCHEAFYKLTEGVMRDRTPHKIQDEADLLDYADSVAGTVGRLMARILGASSAEALPYATALGQAMQMSNIARDVAEDYKRGYIYLPLTWVRDEADIKRASLSAIRHLVDLADVYYAQGEDGISYLPRDVRPAILSAARLYRAIGHKVRRNPAAVWQGRVATSTLEKAGITTKSMFAMARPAFWRDHERGM